jgi:hypothetical protein
MLAEQVIDNCIKIAEKEELSKDKPKKELVNKILEKFILVIIPNEKRKP